MNSHVRSELSARNESQRSERPHERVLDHLVDVRPLTEADGKTRERRRVPRHQARRGSLVAGSPPGYELQIGGIVIGLMVLGHAGHSVRRLDDDNVKNPLTLEEEPLGSRGPMAYASATRPARPWIIGHRGSPRDHRENTLPSFLRAFDVGAEAIELDVHGTADGAVVIHHDAVDELTSR